MSPLLAPGARVAVVAPAGVHNVARLEAGLDIARAHGVQLELVPDLLAPHRYLAGNDAHRLRQLTDVLTDPAWDAVWISRGGYGVTRLLPILAFDQLVAKPIIGFSDVTALFCALHPLGLGPLIHGPVVHSLPGTNAASTAHLFAMLAGHSPAPLVGDSWVEGHAQGPVVGGNLCLLAALCGTPWQLDVSGCILVLEEVGEPAYRVDRMLQQLLSAGGLRGVRGIALGQFERCRVPERATWTLQQVLTEQLSPLGVPVVGNLPIGHGPSNYAFPWGVNARVGAGTLSWAPSLS